MAWLAVAAYLYREKNGRFPEKLQNLVPDFVPFLPVDPYDGKTLRFKRTDGGVVVYSIGPDMTDDGGAPMDVKKANRRHHLRVVGSENGRPLIQTIAFPAANRPELKMRVAQLQLVC